MVICIQYFFVVSIWDSKSLCFSMETRSMRADSMWRVLHNRGDTLNINSQNQIALRLAVLTELIISSFASTSRAAITPKHQNATSCKATRVRKKVIRQFGFFLVFVAQDRDKLRLLKKILGVMIMSRFV